VNRYRAVIRYTPDCRHVVATYVDCLLPPLIFFFFFFFATLPLEGYIILPSSSRHAPPGDDIFFFIFSSSLRRAGLFSCLMPMLFHTYADYFRRRCH